MIALIRVGDIWESIEASSSDTACGSFKDPTFAGGHDAAGHVKREERSVVTRGEMLFV